MRLRGGQVSGVVVGLLARPQMDSVKKENDGDAWRSPGCLTTIRRLDTRFSAPKELLRLKEIRRLSATALQTP